MEIPICSECGGGGKAFPDHEEWCSQYQQAKAGGWVLGCSQKVKHRVVKDPYQAHPSHRSDGSLLSIGTYVLTACGEEIGALSGHGDRRERELLAKASVCKRCAKKEMGKKVQLAGPTAVEIALDDIESVADALHSGDIFQLRSIRHDLGSKLVKARITLQEALQRLPRS